MTGFAAKREDELSCPALYAISCKFQVLLQVISNGCQVHAFVCLPDANGVYLPQPQKFLEGAENRFHSTLSFAFHIASSAALHALYIPFVFLSVCGNIDPFLVAFTNAGLPYRAAFTISPSSKIVVF